MYRKLLAVFILFFMTSTLIFASRDGVYSVGAGYNYSRYRTTDLANNSISYLLSKESYYNQGLAGLSAALSINDIFFYTHKGINSEFRPYNTAISVNLSLMPVIRYVFMDRFTIFAGAGIGAGIDFIHFKTNSFKAEANLAITAGTGIDVIISGPLSIRIGANAALPFYRHDIMHPSATGFDFFLFSVTPYAALGFNFTDGFSWK